MTEPTYVFKMKWRNMFLNSNDEFKSPAGLHGSTKNFSSEEEAVAKAEALGVNLDHIRIIRFRSNS